MRYSNTFLFSEDISRFQVTHMSISIIYFYRVLQLIFKSTGGCFSREEVKKARVGGEHLIEIDDQQLLSIRCICLVQPSSST